MAIPGQDLGVDLVDTGDIGPADASVKLAHHAHDHKRSKFSQRVGQYLKPRNYDVGSSAMKKAITAALVGAGMLVVFSTLFIGFSLGFEHLLGDFAKSFSSSIGQWFGGTAADSAFAQSVTATIQKGIIALPAAALTGGAWYGAKDYIKYKNIEDEEREAATKETKTVREHAQEKGQDVPFQGLETVLAGKREAETSQQRPAYLSKILEEGPQSLSPREVAERIAQERTASQDSSRA